MRVVLISFLISFLFASDFETYKSNLNKEFKDYRDKEFSKYLDKEWKEFKLSQKDNFLEGKFRDIPKANGEDIIVKKELKLGKLRDLNISKTSVLKYKHFDKKDDEREVSFYFFASLLSFNIDKGFYLDPITKLNNKSIRKAWDRLAKSKYSSLIEQFKDKIRVMNLNDWGVYLLVYRFSKFLYKDEGRAIVSAWFLMNKLYYDVRLAFGGSDIYFLANVDGKIYSKPYFVINTKKYYVLNTKRDKLFDIMTYEGSHPQSTRLIDLSLSKFPNFMDIYKSKKLKFEYDEKTYILDLKYSYPLVAFFKDYPQVSFFNYLKADISFATKRDLLNSLRPILKGKTELEAINILLRFVQKAFAYKIDEEQFKKEKVMFLEEVIFYPYSDCEDRVVIFSYLVRNLLGLDIIAIRYPKHIATAIHLKSKVLSKSKLRVDGKDYYIADPTYINANIGQEMPDLKDVKKEVIRF